MRYFGIWGFGDLGISKAEAEKSGDHGLVRRFCSPVPLSPKTSQGSGSEILLRKWVKRVKGVKVKPGGRRRTARRRHVALSFVGSHTPRFYPGLTCFSIPFDGITLYQFKLKFFPQFL